MVNLVVKNLIPPGPAVSNTGKFTVDIVRVKNTGSLQKNMNK